MVKVANGHFVSGRSQNSARDVESCLSDVAIDLVGYGNKCTEISSLVTLYWEVL